MTDRRYEAMADYYKDKSDRGKPDWTLLPWDALGAVVEILTEALSRYDRCSWSTVPDARRRYAAALMRHHSAIALGERYDSDSGLLHSAHRAVNALFLLALDIRAEGGEEQ